MLHPRDKFLKFEEESHKYTISISGKEEEYTSVTTMIKKYFGSDFVPEDVVRKMKKVTKKERYPGMTDEQIMEQWQNKGKEARDLGTMLHKSIEKTILEDKICHVCEEIREEYDMFKSFWEQFNKKYKTFGTEWMIFDEEIKIAGAIDYIGMNEKGELILIDWKRAKKLDRVGYSKADKPFEKFDCCNLNEYAIQLNTYRTILERKYNKKVFAMMLVVFSPLKTNYMCQVIPKINLDDVWFKL